MGSIRPEVVALSERLVGHRRHFHKYPELSLEEFQTCECIVGELKRIGGDDIEIQRGRVECGWDTAVVAIITGTHEAGNSERERCIALRADMDGLPIQETNEGIEYKSLNPGKHHACGHDGHMAMLLVAAEVIFHNRDGFAGKVKLLFQPGEEGKGGAKLMLDAGVLEKPKVQQVYGIHLWNYLRQGVVGVKNGNLMAGSQMFEISITGKGGHGAAPQ